MIQNCMKKLLYHLVYIQCIYIQSSKHSNDGMLIAPGLVLVILCNIGCYLCRKIIRIGSAIKLARMNGIEERKSRIIRACTHTQTQTHINVKSNWHRSSVPKQLWISIFQRFFFLMLLLFYSLFIVCSAFVLFYFMFFSR